MWTLDFDFRPLASKKPFTLKFKYARLAKYLQGSSGFLAGLAFRVLFFLQFRLFLTILSACGGF